MSQIWIPSKFRIEILLGELVQLIQHADTISEIEKELDDKLSELQCHIANRAGVERGEIE